jgi:hypothetical protein
MIVSIGAPVINVSFSEFNTQPKNDVVRVFQCKDASCSQQQQLAELSGTYLKAQEVIATTGFLKVVFTSDSAGEYDGFTAIWNTVRQL